MAYIKRHLVDDETVIDKELLDYMQDGIVEAIEKNCKTIQLSEAYETLGEQLDAIVANPEAYSFIANVFTDFPDESFVLHFEADNPETLTYSNTVMRDDVKYYLVMGIDKTSGDYLMDAIVNEVPQGNRGTGILKVTTAPTSYTTATGGKNPIKRMALSTIKSQSGVSEVLVGDLIAYSYYQYHVYYLDATYAYMDTYASVRGSTGAAGRDGENGADGADGVSAYEYAQEGGYTGTEAQFALLLANAVDKGNITLGLHTDGKLYVFIDGAPVGSGVELQGGGSGDSGESGGGSDTSIPTYYYTETARVINLIEAFKAAHPNHLIFGAVSDIHISNDGNENEEYGKKSIQHSAYALEVVGSAVECDFIANLGDNCAEGHIDPTLTTDAKPCGLENAEYAMSVLSPVFDKLTSFNLVGNHDKSDHTSDQYNLIGVHNDFDVASTTTIRGFGYKDYTDKKVRVIVLNTCDYLNASGGCALSYEQKDFLMRALDLSAKTDYADWQILLLSHIPLDWDDGDYNFYTDLQEILFAYENGTTANVTVLSSYALNETPSSYATYSSGKLVYNYSGKNSAKIIANIHGHLHNNKVGKIVNTNIARISTANTSPYGNASERYPEYGDYSITTEEASKLVKVAGTARNTSATFYCIDLDEQKIYEYVYGARNEDVDRQIIYKEAKIYSVTYNLTNCTLTNTATQVVEGESYTTRIIPVGVDDVNFEDGVNYEVTIGGVSVGGYDSSDGTITIQEVTGDIVINVEVLIPLITETITPHIAPRSTWYNGLSGGNITLNSSNMEGALGVSTPNSYAYTDRNSKKFYLMPIDSKYCEATLNYSATDGLAVKYYMQAVKDNGGTFTSVATIGKSPVSNVLNWEKGTADYLLISIEHADGATKWDWNSAGKTITVTFSNGGTSVLAIDE